MSRLSHCRFTYCLAVALPIDSLSLCLLSRFLVNNGNGKFSLDGYLVHQQCYPAFVEMESSECESADDTDAEQLATAHCTSAQQIGEGARLLRRKQINWLRNAWGRNATELRVLRIEIACLSVLGDIS